jgi:hypothetical protein
MKATILYWSQYWMIIKDGMLRGDDERITFMQGLWGKGFSRPENITQARAWEDGTMIDIQFKNQDHVAVYWVQDGKAVFDGFES